MISPLAVTPEEIEAYEEVSGFKGIGGRMIRAGIWELTEETCQKPGKAPLPSTTAKITERGAPILSFHR